MRLALVLALLTTLSTAKAEPQVVLVKPIVPTIVEDMRYATANNFLKTAVYTDKRCWLQPMVAVKLAEAARLLDKKQPGWQLKVWDCYRPREVQFKMWEVMPDPKYVADPRKGSRHNTGNAVDITIVDENGNEVEMPTEFDNFTKKAWPDAATTSAAAANRSLLRDVMMRAGFRPITTEWWHFTAG